MRLRATLSVLLLLLTSLPAAAQEIILVRHAEKGTEADPGLTPDGQTRAQALADLMKASPPVMILTSPARRTQETAAPVAAQASVTPEVVPMPPGDMPAHVRAVAERLRTLKPGQVALVVGHSNTVPAIIKALGGPPLPNLPECAFDRLFRWDVANKTLREEWYGEESACD